jgi:hypothetical protein
MFKLILGNENMKCESINIFNKAMHVTISYVYLTHSLWVGAVVGRVSKFEGFPSTKVLHDMHGAFSFMLIALGVNELYS